MSNPAFIVDGFTEKRLIQELCPGQPVRRTDLNGKSVEIPAIANKIASLIRLLGNRYYPIVILVDKEERNVTFEEMVNQIRQSLINCGITDQEVRIGVADMMIENWIIADWESLNGSSSGMPSNSEGINGSGIIKKIKGGYHKTTDGVDLFKAARPSIIYRNSPSYKYFIDQLVGINCRYLNFDR